MAGCSGCGPMAAGNRCRRPEAGAARLPFSALGKSIEASSSFETASLLPGRCDRAGLISVCEPACGRSRRLRFCELARCCPGHRCPPAGTGHDDLTSWRRDRSQASLRPARSKRGAASGDTSLVALDGSLDGLPMDPVGTLLGPCWISDGTWPRPAPQADLPPSTAAQLAKQAGVTPRCCASAST
jgi:hypothetical protein